MPATIAWEDLNEVELTPRHDESYWWPSRRFEDAGLRLTVKVIVKHIATDCATAAGTDVTGQSFDPAPWATVLGLGTKNVLAVRFPEGHTRNMSVEVGLEVNNQFGVYLAELIFTDVYKPPPSSKIDGDYTIPVLT